MTARVLVVDDILANVKLLQARLEAEYYEVLTANSGLQALDIIAQTPVDIVLLDVMMPGMDGFEVCRRIKANPDTHHIPVVMVTALDQQSDRVTGLEAGADDFLTKPVNDLAMLTRVRSLIRLKMMQDELRQRAMSSRNHGLRDAISALMNEQGLQGNILLVDDRMSSVDRIVTSLRGQQKVTVQKNPSFALEQCKNELFDLVIISMALIDFDALRLCSQIRSDESLRQLPLLLISEPELEAKLLRGLDMGVNDYVHRPIDKNELVARVRTQIRRKRSSDKLREKVTESIEMAVTDGLTGLNNRRYMETHAPVLIQQANIRQRPLSVLMLDIDHFKSVNDTYGHDAGDDVLREFASRIKKSVRNVDLACRLGGEEFVVIMPEADSDIAFVTAERLRERVASEPFFIAGGTKSIMITVSIGAASRLHDYDTSELMIKRADDAVYAAKRNGRNQVMKAAA
jgi:two-component system, cell cycle response regulator